MMSINVSFGITVCNEHKKLSELLNILREGKRENDEIVILVDEDNHTEEVLQVCTGFGYEPVFHPLNRNFAAHKNYLNSMCNKEYIFSIDADEKPHELLLENLHDIIEENDTDLMWVPRVNIVNGITDEHLNKWGWRQNPNGWVNFPDYQPRIYKNDYRIKWEGRVHEQITGFRDYAKLPAYEELSLFHVKEIKRQEKQNEFYNKIER